MTAKYALIGHPLEFSLSPVLHNAAFAHLGIDASYWLRPTPPAALGDVMRDLRAGDLAGVNVTVPHKVAAALLVEEESDDVRTTGAVNTIVRSPDGFWRGENTDLVGFRHALGQLGMLGKLRDGGEPDMPPAPSGGGRSEPARALVLGAGGAARAVAVVLLRAGYRVELLNRGSARAGVAAAHIYRHMPGALLDTGPLRRSDLPRRADGAALLVNATPVGARAEPPRPDETSQSVDGDCPWPDGVPFPTELAVIELVAWPPETELVRRALAAGAPAVGGLGMLVAQAAAAFGLWTAERAPIEVMRAAAEAALAQHGATGLQGQFLQVAGPRGDSRWSVPR